MQENKYFTSEDYDKLIHFQMPKVLMYGEKYKKLSNDAKMLYMVAFDLTKVSMSNHGKKDKNGNRMIWKDEKGFFIKLAVKTIQTIMGVGRTKAGELKRELEKYNLIQQKRVGLQKSNMVYVMQLTYTEEDIYTINDLHEMLIDGDSEEVKEITKKEASKPGGSTDARKTVIQKAGKRSSRCPENGHPDARKSSPINNKENNNKKNNNIKDKDLVNKEKVNKKYILDISNTLYSELAPGRWSKEAWITITEKQANELLENKFYNFVDQKNWKNYILGATRNLAHAHDIKHEKIIVSLPEVEGSSNYNWLDPIQREEAQKPLKELDQLGVY